MKVKILLFVLAAFLITNLLFIDDADAIPAFARRYKISCNTCHAPFPKLKPYGDDFAGAGFILQENEKERDYVTAGDDLMWLNKEFPLAVRFDAFGVYESDNQVENDLQSPYGIKLLSGGTLYKNIGYYFYFYMNETGEVAGIEDAYIHFDNVFGTNLDVMVGQFQTCDPLMKRELRLTYEDYMIYKTKVGLSGTNLTYDRGVILAYGIDKTGTDLIAQIVNGNGKGEAENHKFDNNSFKNVGLKLHQNISDIGSIGLFYYTGKDTEYFAGGESENEIMYYGPDLAVGVGPFDLTVQYLIREDSNPLFYDIATDIKTTGIVTELVYSPQLDRSRWYLTALYNNITSDIDDYKQELRDLGLDTQGYHTATLSGTYLLSRNIRLVAEYTRDIDLEINRAVVGLVTAF
jgi:hypothetical protein